MTAARGRLTYAPGISQRIPVDLWQYGFAAAYSPSGRGSACIAGAADENIRAPDIWFGRFRKPAR
jgi:hypothetical protein